MFINFQNIFIVLLFLLISRPIKAGLNSFSPLIYVDDWLIERKVGRVEYEIKCRASIPSTATWFGARIRLGPKNELIQPNWIAVTEDQLLVSKLSEVKKTLYDCRSGLLFLPHN